MVKCDPGLVLVKWCPTTTWASGCHPGDMADEDPVDVALASGLVQPDETTCGSCVLVVVRMVNDPAYARSLVDEPVTAAGEQRPGTLQDRFRHQALEMQRLTSGSEDSRGEWQPPWPRRLGTPPWAMAREMTNQAGEKGTRYHARPVVAGRRSRAFDRIAALTRAGHAVPLYVGNRWAPRHVVAALPTGHPPRRAVVVYDPATGRRYPIAAGDFAAGSLQVAGWRVPWAVVVPA